MTFTIIFTVKCMTTIHMEVLQTLEMFINTYAQLTTELLNVGQKVLPNYQVPQKYVMFTLL